MREGLQEEGTQWWLLRLMNTATITREWVALQHAHLMPFAGGRGCKAWAVNGYLRPAVVHENAVLRP